MKHLQIYENFSKKKKIYTLEEVQKIQSKKGFFSSDIIFDSHPSDKFELMNVPINFVKNPSSYQDYQKHNMDEDISIVDKLMRLYLNGENVTPIVIDENGKIMDGIHRYVAQKELGAMDIQVFKRIGEIKLENIRVLSKEEINEGSKVKEDILYHFTGVWGVLGILETKKLRNDMNKDYMDSGNVSFTTDFNFYKKAISKFGAHKKAVALVFDAARMREDGIKMFYHVYKGTKNFDYSAESEVRVPAEVSTKYLKEIIFINRIAEKEPVFYKEALKAVRDKGIPYKIFK
jgi:hypothetical protein